MARVMTVSVPDELVPVWEKAVERFGGASKFVQTVLRAVESGLREANNNPTARQLRRALLEERVKLLELERDAIAAECEREKKRLADPNLGEGSPPDNGEGSSVEEWVAREFRKDAAWFTTIPDEQVRRMATQRQFDPEQALEVRRARAARVRGAGT